MDDHGIQKAQVAVADRQEDRHQQRSSSNLPAAGESSHHIRDTAADGKIKFYSENELYLAESAHQSNTGLTPPDHYDGGGGHGVSSKHRTS